MLVAVHPWDIDGAARAGLATAWINRTGDPYPEYFRAPDIQVGSLTALADALSATARSCWHHTPSALTPTRARGLG